MSRIGEFFARLFMPIGEPPPRRRSIENPATPLSEADDWLVEAWGGGTSSSGMRVNSETALAYSPVWRACNLIGRDVAKLPLLTYRRSGTGKERAPEHPSYHLLRFKPNRESTFFPFRFHLQVQALLRGNGYAHIIRDPGGKPTELVPLDSGSTRPERRGERLFYITVIDGQERLIDRGNMLHIRGLTDGGIAGKSVIAKARESMGLGMAAQKYGAVFFRNQARPSAVLEHPAMMSQEDHARFKADWQAAYSQEKAHSTAILENGMKLHTFSISNEDAQFLETRQFEIREVANWFGVPPHKLGDTTRTAFASLEQENQAYLDDALDPWLVCWEAECWDKLLTEEEKLADTHLIEFLRQALLRANLVDRSNFYASALQNGYMNRDEVRARENLNPLPNGEGEKFFIPKNMSLSGEKKPEEEPETTPPAAPKKNEAERSAAHRALLVDLVGRLVRRITLTARRRAKGSAKHDGKCAIADAYMDWLEGELEAEHRPVGIEAAAPVVAVLRQAVDCPAEGVLLDLVFTEAREALLSAAECQPKDLEASVKATCERLEASLPGRVADRFFAQEKVTHGA